MGQGFIRMDGGRFGREKVWMGRRIAVDELVGTVDGINGIFINPVCPVDWDYDDVDGFSSSLST